MTLPRLFVFVAMALAISAACLPHGAAKPIYRGVATNAWSGGCSDINALSRMSWYYNWGLQPTANVASCHLGSRYVEFVPMVWGAGSVPNLVSKLPANTKHLLGFNEPNFASQANLSPRAAATEWKKVIAQLDAAGLTGKIKLGTPSAAPGGNIGPKEWFAQFFGNCTGCHFDFLCFHIYDCNAPWFDAGAVNYWLGQVKGFGLPIWLTEFDCPFNSVANELTWMERVLGSLDSDPQVERYAWFTARATNVGTAPSLLNSAAGSLTQVGAHYNSKGDRLTP